MVVVQLFFLAFCFVMRTSTKGKRRKHILSLFNLYPFFVLFIIYVYTLEAILEGWDDMGMIQALVKD